MPRDRGRPHGRYHGVADFTAMEYIDRISMKYDLDLNIFFSSFVEAWQCQQSKCEGLLIECRIKTRDYSIFLVTEGFNVVAQLHVPNHILQETNPIKNFISEKNLRPKIMAKVNVENPSIKELRIGMKGIKLTGKVTKISKSNTVYGRFGEEKTVANAKLSDETGFIQFPLWNQQIETIAPGDLLQIENAYVGSFKGELQLRIRKRGKLIVIQKFNKIKQPKKVNKTVR
jgi:replication factor A1